METYTVRKASNQTIIGSKVRMADTAWTRMVGLLNTAHLNPGEGLIITQCNSIHMFFMKYPIDVIFVDKSGAVVGLVQDIKPFRLSRIYFRAHLAIELPSGTIAQNNVQSNDTILISPN